MPMNREWKGATIHSGQGVPPPHQNAEGMRTGVVNNTPNADAYFGNSKRPGPVADGLTSGAKLHGGAGKFPRGS